MIKSTDRILTTHAGSLPRGEPLGSMLIDQEAGKPVDPAKLTDAIEARVTHVLKKQVESGVDEADFPVGFIVRHAVFGDALAAQLDREVAVEQVVVDEVIFDHLALVAQAQDEVVEAVRGVHLHDVP